MKTSMTDIFMSKDSGVPKAGPRHLAHMIFSSGESDKPHVSCRDGSPRTAHTFDRSGMVVIFWVEKLLLVIKLVFGGPGIVAVTPAKGAR
jgi:hypothetical protein